MGIFDICTQLTYEQMDVQIRFSAYHFANSVLQSHSSAKKNRNTTENEIKTNENEAMLNRGTTHIKINLCVCCERCECGLLC